MNIDAPQSHTSPSTLKAPKTKVGLLILLAVLLLAAATVAYQNRPSAHLTSPTSTSEIGQKVFKVEVDKAGKLVSGPSSLTIKKGDKVHLQFSAQAGMDEADLRLEAYELTASMIGNSVADIEFTADKPGTFPLEIKLYHEDNHESHDQAESAWNRLLTVTIR